MRAHRKEQVDAGHFVDDEGLKAKEEDGEVVHPLQHGRHRRNVHQVAREQQAQQQHLAHHTHSTSQHSCIISRLFWPSRATTKANQDHPSVSHSHQCPSETRC